MDLTTTVIGFALSATFIIFVCTRFVCGRIRHEGPGPMLEGRSWIDLEQPEPLSTCPLARILIASIPTTKFSHDIIPSINDPQCSICLGEYQDREVLRIMPKCGHDFHSSCIDTWLSKHPTCPVCRFPLQDLFEQKMSMNESEGLEPASNQSQH